MRDIYLKFGGIALDDEDKYFPAGFTPEQKTMSEYIALLSYYLDSGSNEINFLSNQRVVIEDTLDAIRQLIQLKKFEMAQYHIVAMQMVLGLEIRLKNTLRIMMEEHMNIDLFMNSKKYYKNTNKEEYEELGNTSREELRKKLEQMRKELEDQFDDENDHDKGGLTR